MAGWVHAGFNPRAREGATQLTHVGRAAGVVSTHAPVKARRALGHQPLPVGTSFNPRAREGATLPTTTMAIFPFMFQPTRP